MRTKSVLAAAALAAFATPALAIECQFYSTSPEQSLDGECTVEYGDQGTVIQIGKKKIVFVEASRQGQWTVGTFDGKPAARYEINREQYSYATLDLTVFVDIAE
ncbi:MAG: hypothetical protein AB7S80_14965 [Rhizobiaceae bacterium]